MREFRYSGYHTEYSCHGDITLDKKVRACFRDVYIGIKKGADVTYEIHFHKGIDYQQYTGEGSACVITEEQMCMLLDSLREIYDFEYKIEEYEEGRWHKYLLTLHIKDVPSTFHKFVLSTFRCVYEFPHNLLLKDAFELKEREPFNQDSILALLNLTLGCCPEQLHDEHLPIEGRYLYNVPTVKELRSRIARVVSVQNIYKSLCESIYLDDKVKNGKIYYTYRDREFWDTNFEERLKRYEMARNKREGYLGKNTEKLLPICEYLLLVVVLAIRDS